MLIIFDLDDTLINTSLSLGPKKLRDVIEKLAASGVEIDDIETEWKEICEIDKKSSSGKKSIVEYLKRKGADWNLEIVDLAIEEYYENIPSNFEIFAMPNANLVLKELAQKGHSLAIVSFGIHEQQIAKLNNSGLAKEVFDPVIITPKHDKKKQYLRILENKGYLAKDTIVIGDSLERDLIPAKEAGIKSVLMRHGRGKHANTDGKGIDFEIEDLLAIRGIIEKLC